MTTMRFLSLVGNSFGCSASGERLVSAARDGDLQEAKALLEYNPRLARYSTFGVRNSPLHYSAAQGHHEIVLLLIESGVDINLRNYRGQTALMLACQYGHWEVVQILILFQANIHTTDCLNGGTALHLAAVNGHTRCIRLLLADHIPSIPNFATILRKRLKNDKSVSQFDEGSLYATINKAGDGGMTALHMAALNCHVETVHLLLDLGASVSNKTLLDGDTIDLIGAGSTSLHYAACGGNTQCCQLLIARGASLTTENAKGWTPLAVARSWHRDWLEDILTPESSGRRRLCHSPYLCLPLMSIVEIARECGWRGDNDTPTASDPCVVCLERKCIVAGQGCFHELCTRCALYLCSTNSSSTVADGPPGAIPCPLCRQGIISFVKLAGTKPKVKEMSRTRSMPLRPCSGTQVPAKTGSIEMAISKPEFLSPLNSPFKSVGCQSFASSKFKPGLCLGGTDRSPDLGPINIESCPPARNQLVKYSRLRSLLRRTASQNEGRRWLCSFTQSMPPGSS